MRSTLLLSIVGFFTVAANAASINKRTISSEVQVCIDQLNLVGPKMDNLQAYLNTFDTGETEYNLATDLKIHTFKREVNTALETSGIACCDVSSPVFTDEEAPALLSIYQGITPKVQEYTQSYIAKYPIIYEIPFYLIVYMLDFKNATQFSDTLGGCLVSRSPSAQSDAFTAEMNLIRAAYDEAHTVYSNIPEA
ncbi:hypothetical protein BDB01DRAFT_354945 [Pilobolus umbonatus]|nr:hypothetical protein BDB01DRAFT_354945 [Pilobolus umbonatus]